MCAGSPRSSDILTAAEVRRAKLKSTIETHRMKLGSPLHLPRIANFSLPSSGCWACIEERIK
jgi:hypothetical protein